MKRALLDREETTLEYVALPGDIKSHNKTRHLLVSPDCFKQSLMMLEMSRAKEIRRYYVALEKIFKSYIRYCNAYTARQLEKEKKKKEQ
ncbi:hypothetical protein PC123_g20235 [Phytophthora cactorum]|nr:hypothetical protein PC123_g20235 [Phytophthora cactorum]